jgi:hypothetical protein
VVVNFNFCLDDEAEFGFAKGVFDFALVEFFETEFHASELGVFFIEEDEFEFTVYDFCAGAVEAAGVGTGVYFGVDVGEAEAGQVYAVGSS